MGRAFARTSNGSRALVVGLTTIVAILATSFATGERQAKAGSYGYSGAEKCLMRKINHARHRRGIHRLRHDRQIAYVARRHARKMARHRAIWDDGSLGYKVTKWRTLGQNSGYAKHCKRMFKSFMHSAVHRLNILGHYRFMGVGVKRRHGKLYTSQIFESRHNPGNKWHYP